MSTRRHNARRRAGIVPAFIAALCLAPTPALAQDAATGGLEATPGGLDVRPSLARRALRIAGDIGPGHAGRTVRVERQRIDGTWEPIATAVADAEGAFVATWRSDLPGRYALRATVERGADTATAATTSELLGGVSVFARATASWYGPRFFGRRTACGIRLTRQTIGVAHRKLPCGTRVEVLHRGRTLVVPVIDRGPFVRGRQWDLTQAAAKALGMTATSRIGVLPAL